MTLIAVYNSEGCIGRCDARCYNATTPKCTCVCGGMNHGCGQAKAIDNTAEYVEAIVDAYKEQHPDQEFDFHYDEGNVKQKRLF